MPSFEDLGLRQELLRALEDVDLERPTALQEAVIPTLRRGTNLVARASSGAGKTLAYALGIIDRFRPREEDEEEGQTAAALRFLILVPTREEAERVALSLFPVAQAAGMSVTVPGGSWGLPIAAAEILVTPPADILEEVRASAVKLESLEAVVVDGASTIQQLGDWERVDTLLDHVPRDAQRVLFSAAFPDEVQDLIDRRVKRALTYPPEAALAEEPAEPREGTVGFVLARGGDKLEVLARQLAQPKEDAGAPPVIFCRSDERAADLAEQLSVRGFMVGAVDDGEADVAVVSADATRQELLEEAGATIGQTISFDVPTDVRTLKARHGGDEDAVALVEPREVAHLREIARQANLKARSLPLPVDRGVTATRLDAFRAELRRAIAEEDLAAQLLVLDPLLEEFSALEVASAAAALLRRRRPAAVPTEAAGAAVTPAAATARAAERGSRARHLRAAVRERRQPRRDPPRGPRGRPRRRSQHPGEQDRENRHPRELLDRRGGRRGGGPGDPRRERHHHQRT